MNARLAEPDYQLVWPRGRRTITRLRRELFCVPARVVHHARRIELRLPPGPQLLTIVLARLRALPALA